MIRNKHNTIIVIKDPFWHLVHEWKNAPEETLA